MVHTQTNDLFSIAASKAARIAAIALACAGCSSGGGAGDGPATPVLNAVSLSAPSQTVVAGGTVQLGATPRDQSGNSISATVTWSSSASNVAAVDASGLVTAVAAGSATITATATSGAKIVTGNIAITVTPVPVPTTVTVAAAQSSILIGATDQLTATVKDQFGNAFAATVTWSTSASTVATVNTNGLVTAVAAGTATITATAAGGGPTVTGNTVITITAPIVPALTSVSIAAPATSVVIGNTDQLTASPRDQTGAAIAATVLWSSSASGIASVNSSGLVSAIAAGVATITASATAGGVTVQNTLQITVTPVVPVLTTVTVNAPQTSIVAGNTITLTATATDQNGSLIGGTVTWSSSTPGAATVGANTGVVTGVAAGATTITATVVANGVTKTGTALITVTNPPSVLTSVTISSPSTTIVVGNTVQFTASPKDQFGNPIAAVLTWSSSAPARATISNIGLVTGVATGTTNISVSATANGVTVASSLTVVTVTASFATSASIDAQPIDAFSPASVDVAVGATVTWNFQATHNVTFAFAPGVPSDISDTPSGSAARTFTQAGTFNYQCTLHPGMTGTVIVH